MTNPIVIKMVLDVWHTKVRDADAVFDNLTDEELQKEVAPGRNRGIYLLGHLTAVHDRMLPLLDLGAQLYPHLTDSFITNPDKSKMHAVPVQELRQYWKNTNSILASRFNELQQDDWFQKHSSVSAEDFIKEPHRNKLNIVISRTNHLSYHLGQLVFLKK